MKRLATLILPLLLLLPLFIATPPVEAASSPTNPGYNYLLKIDRDLMKAIGTGESTTVKAIIVASRGLDAVRRLVLSYGGTIRISLESINALAVTLPSSSVESIAKNSNVKKVWLDQEVALQPQTDVSNIKADLMRSLVDKIENKAENVEKTSEDSALLEGLDPEMYAIPEDGMVNLARMTDTYKEDDISLLQIGINDVSPDAWFTYQVGAEKMWAMGYTGTGTYVAVLDVGATVSHPMLGWAQLGGAVVGGHSEVPGEPIWNDPSAIHGTMTSSMAVGRPVVAIMPNWYDLAMAVARWFPEKILTPDMYPWIPPGYIGIAFAGEAIGASLWVEKVLTYGGSGDISWILAGMQHVLYMRRGMGGLPHYHIDVVSMSLGLSMPWSAVNDGTDPWSMMVDVLANSGITVVQSTGNNGPGAFTVSQSACASKNVGAGGYVYARMMKTYYDWYYGVGYSDAYLHMPDEAEMVFYFASRGPTRDYRTGVAAVAPCAFTIGAAENSSLYWGSGTSFSAPRLAGEALLLIQYYRERTGGQYPTAETVRAAIAVGADYIPGYHKIDEGGGRWNAHKASQVILNKNVVGQANNILDVSNYHNTRVTDAVTFTNGVYEYTVDSLEIEHYARFYFELPDPDMYRITITDIDEVHTELNTLYLWVFDAKGDLANIGRSWRSGGTILNYGQTGYYYYLVGETYYSGVYRWNQHWIPNDPGIWEVVVENDFFSWEPVGFTIRIEKSEVDMSASADKVVLKNNGVDIGLSAPGGLKAYEGYTNSVSDTVKKGIVKAIPFTVQPGTTELLVTLDWDDDYFDQFPADLDLYLIDPLNNLWYTLDPPFTPFGILGAAVNIPETDYFGDYTAGNIVAGQWIALVAGYKITPATSNEGFQLTIEGRIRDVTRPTKVYSTESLPYEFELPPLANMLFSGDDTYAAYTLPFDFPCYNGLDYNTIYVGSNGYITFNQGYTYYSDSNIWNMFLTTPTIAVMARDLVTSAYAIPHDNYVTILWYGREYGGGPDRNLMLAQLYDNGDIVMSYADWVGGLAGVSKGDGATYMTISPSDMTAYQFTYSATIIITQIWSYTVTSIPFTWDPTGTLLFSGDDTYGTYTMPFSFPFYGNNYNTLYIGSNGYITFDHGHTSYSPSTIWNTIFLTSPAIAVMGKDLVSQVYVSNHGNYVTLRWYGRAYGYPPDHDLMEVQLYDNGDIIMSYTDWQYTQNAGVSKGDGTTYVTITPASGTSFQFVYTLTTIESKIVSYTISSVPFVWEEIAMPLVSGDDAYAAYTLPFDFPFCGSTYRTVYAGTNGYITLTQGYTSYSGLAGLFMSTPMIAAMAEDLVSTIYAFDHETYVTFLWIGRPFGETTVRPLMEAKLYSDGAVILSYADWVSPDYWGAEAIAGVSDGDGVNYVRVYPSDQTTFRITVAAIIPPAIEFMNANPWLPAGATVEVYYTENVAGNYVFVSKHYWVEKFFRDGGTGAWIYGRFLYDNSEAYH